MKDNPIVKVVFVVELKRKALNTEVFVFLVKIILCIRLVFQFMYPEKHVHAYLKKVIVLVLSTPL